MRIMNEKEVGEIRRRYRVDKSNISRIRGCYVNEKREIISEFNQSFGLLSQNESEEMLSILKKTLSGSLGKNLLNIEFATQQVLNGEEHQLLMALRGSSLEDDSAVAEFFRRVVESVTLPGSYMILLSCEKYDVFSYSKDGARSDDSSSVFSYILCSICPVKLTKPALSYYAYENTFHNIDANTIVGAPELGFMFPAFDDRAANIYSTLYYTRNASENHEEFVDRIFKCPLPMPADLQKETFGNILSETIADDCNLDVVQTVHDQITEMIEEHKADKDDEPLMVSKKTLKGVLKTCGIEDKKLDDFEAKYDEQFGADTTISPQNLVNTKQFELRSANVSIKVSPDRSDLLKTQIIDDTKYILIRADEAVEVNGVPIHI